jgi:hypothetical protein
MHEFVKKYLKMVQKWSKNGPKIVQKLSKNCPKMLCWRMFEKLRKHPKRGWIGIQIAADRVGGSPFG